MNEEVVQSAMAIILNAGDARVACKEALDAIAAFDYETAEEKLKVCHEKITVAHKVQTDAIQDETRGEKSEYYQAVLRDGVRTMPDFMRWRAEHPVNGVMEWMP